MSGMDLIAWVEAQLDFDEEAARDTSLDGAAHTIGCGYDQVEFSVACKCGWPKRLLDEIAAKRASLAEHQRSTGRAARADEEDLPKIAESHRRRLFQTLYPVVRILAQPYAGRPGWRDEWKVQL